MKSNGGKDLLLVLHKPQLIWLVDPGSYVALLGDAAHSFPPDLGQVCYFSN